MNRRVTTFIRQLGQNTTSSQGWFLPSIYELREAALNLYSYGLWGSAETGLYHTSTENDEYSSYQLLVSSANIYTLNKGTSKPVRPIRVFSIIEGSYSLNIRDMGTYGYIFYRSTDGATSTYYEASPTNIAIPVVWSNISSSAVTGTGSVIGTGLNNTNLIVAQIGHTDSAAEKCLEHVVTI